MLLGVAGLKLQKTTNAISLVAQPRSIKLNCILNCPGRGDLVRERDRALVAVAVADKLCAFL
jgi:hypothetical protein